jgi:hypothetical protein
VVDEQRRLRAIEIIEASRSTHASWLEWQRATPNWQRHVVPESPGGPEHHERCIAEYDEVLAFLAELGNDEVTDGQA